MTHNTHTPAKHLRHTAMTTYVFCRMTSLEHHLFISFQSFGRTARHVWEISKHFAECVICNTRNTFSVITIDLPTTRSYTATSMFTFSSDHNNSCLGCTWQSQPCMLLSISLKFIFVATFFTWIWNCFSQLLLLFQYQKLQFSGIKLQ